MMCCLSIYIRTYQPITHHPRQVYQLLDIPDPQQHPEGAKPQVLSTIVLGLVKLIHVRNAVLTPEGTVDPALYKPLVRLGGNQYATLGDGFTIPRPRWEEVRDLVVDDRGQKVDK